MPLLRHPYPRRLLTGPAVAGLLFLLVTLLPLWVLAAAALSPLLPGRMRGLRLLWFLIVYLGLEVLGLVAAAGLWVASGFGYLLRRERFLRVHYRMLAGLLGVLMLAARRLFNLDLEVEADPPPDEQPDVPHDDPRPMIVLARHAGPLDSFLLVHELQWAYGRSPRIVLKSTFQWDPLIDVLLHRLHTRFISSAREGMAETIGELAGDLGPEDAVMIFPEGANFTRGRRERMIARLEAEGLEERAQRARRLRNLLPPRPGGALAAIRAAPHADVVFLAHAGIEHLYTVRDVWDALPMDTAVRARMWTVPAEEVPTDDEARMDWLYDWWDRLDDWLEEAQGTATLREPRARRRGAAGQGRAGG
jgi:1-acyl-sn-glycerol-3-phosphate acyltransferase